MGLFLLFEGISAKRKQAAKPGIVLQTLSTQQKLGIVWYMLPYITYVDQKNNPRKSSIRHMKADTKAETYLMENLSHTHFETASGTK